MMKKINNNDISKNIFCHFSSKEYLLDLEYFIRKHGGLLIFVGGAIRSIILNNKVHDYDAEVYLLSEQKLHDILTEYAKKINTNLLKVGAQFGVFKLSSLNVDIAIPRTEVSTGLKYTDFDVKFNIKMPYSVATLRRDFKMNTFGYSRYFSVFLDPNNGIDDINSKTINIVRSIDIFLEDPLRLLRAIYFSNKLNFQLSKEIVNAIKTNDSLLKNISIERIANEFYKVLISRKINYIYYFGYIKNSDVYFLNVLSSIVDNKVALKMISCINTIQGRLFFILVHSFNQQIIDFYKKMPNHKTCSLNEVLIVASIYYYTYIDNKNNTKSKQFLRVLQQENTYNNIKNLLFKLDSETVLRSHIVKVTKIITLYMINFKRCNYHKLNNFKKFKTN